MIDMHGEVCRKCKQGTYQETGFFDDMDGVLHCKNCGAQTKRWIEDDEIEERTVIVDELYLMTLQSKITLMKETLTKIYKAEDIFCLSDAQYEARKTIDKINNW